eukprot:CAMPEP_0172491706 /NCGR_PEP_ID=MMETSP1066-20121228/22562_1 /TAXON_ID=671091 /ORGANISM="Coscinodiscus wailesii, Strain CCMP2513" /LENGTH=719 /DNA_ID=CAMNT_0013260875 /DNA_START=38 /DNA_END=2197 /DNA_ORIENTATION=-
MSKDAPLLPPSTPTCDLLRGSYTQTYLIKHAKACDKKLNSKHRDVLFRCGNWCYSGKVAFDFALLGKDDMSLDDIPKVIPTLQRQQGKLTYLCGVECWEEEIEGDDGDGFKEPMEVMQAAQHFVARELTREDVTDKIEKWARGRPWVDDNDATYFELIGDFSNVSSSLKDVQCICSKTYARGLILVTIYFEGVFYVMIQDGTGDQPLLDVLFPDVSRDGEGLTLAIYDEGRGTKGKFQWRKLSMWQSLAPRVDTLDLIMPRTTNLSSSHYIQTYCVCKPTPGSTAEEASIRDVFFRFGSWCYNGRVELTPQLNLVDLPYIIPALRVQQSQLSFYCDVGQLPNKSPFAAPMEYSSTATAVMEREVSNAGELLKKLIERLDESRGRSSGRGGMTGGEGGAVEWLDGDPTASFFEFSFVRDEDDSITAHEDIDLIATKCYNTNGLVTIAVYFEGMYYLSIMEGSEEQPLLDSSFPNVAAKGRGYQIRSYPNGVQQWPHLRKMAIWQIQKEEDDEVHSHEPDQENIIETKITETDDEDDHDEDDAKTTIIEDEVSSSSKSIDPKLTEDEEMEESKKQYPHTTNDQLATSETMAESKDDDETTNNDNASDKQIKDENNIIGNTATTKSSRKKKRRSARDQKATRPVTTAADAKFTPAVTCGQTRQNRGAFHHLAPLKKPSTGSQLEGRLNTIKATVAAHGGFKDVAPWDQSGKPIIFREGEEKI